MNALRKVYCVNVLNHPRHDTTVQLGNATVRREWHVTASLRQGRNEDTYLKGGSNSCFH